MLNPKHILITGASSGIGAALADIYAAPGIRLSLHGRNGDRLNKVAESARQKSAAVTTTIGDITDRKAVGDWVNSCDAQQAIDLLIANAGISAGTGGGCERPELSRAIFATNVDGVLSCIHAVLPLMVQRRHGQIALISSLAGFRGIAGAPSYTASKAAVRTYGEALRGDMIPYNVEVNVVCPGFIKTPLTDMNRFKMPFLMPAPRAAQIIQKGLAHNKGRIAFPLPMYILVRIMAGIPQAWMDYLVQYLPKKGG